MLKIPNLHNWIVALPDPIRHEVESRMSVKKLAAQHKVYSLSEESNGIYLIDKGTVRLCNYTHAGKEILIIDFYENECFGELGVLDHLQRVSNAYCVTDVEMRFLSKKVFWQLYETHPIIPMTLNTFLCRRFHLLFTMVEEASMLSLRERLVRLLLRLASSRGGPDEGEVWLAGISHEILANRTGATRQAVSRELKQLERENLIKLQYGKLAVTGLWAHAEEYEKLLGGEALVPDYSSNP